MNERNCRSSIRFVNICFEMLFLESFRSRHGRVSEGGKILANFYFLIHYHGERANKFHNAALTILECSCEKLSWKVFAVFSFRFAIVTTKTKERKKFISSVGSTKLIRVQVLSMLANTRLAKDAWKTWKNKRKSDNEGKRKNLQEM